MDRRVLLFIEEGKKMRGGSVLECMRSIGWREYFTH